MVPLIIPTELSVDRLQSEEFVVVFFIDAFASKASFNRQCLAVLELDLYIYLLAILQTYLIPMLQTSILNFSVYFLVSPHQSVGMFPIPFDSESSRSCLTLIEEEWLLALKLWWNDPNPMRTMIRRRKGSTTILLYWMLISRVPQGTQNEVKKRCPLGSSYLCAAYKQVEEDVIVQQASVRYNSTRKSVPFFNLKNLWALLLVVMEIMLTPSICRREYFLFASSTGNTYTAWAIDSYWVSEREKWFNLHSFAIQNKALWGFVIYFDFWYIHSVIKI